MSISKSILRPMFATLCLALGSTSACTSEGPAAQETGGPPDGAALFSEPLLGPTLFTCDTCHAVSEPSADGFRRPGHPVGDAAARPNFKNGQLVDLRDAVNSCVTDWIRGEALAADDPRWLALQDFLLSSAPTSASPISYEIVQPPADLSGGDIEAGRDTFNSTCAVCHGLEATGDAIGPSLVNTQQEADYIAARVRLSGLADSSIYPGLQGGAMPFWAADRLSDEELIDIIAFVQDAFDPNATTSSESEATGESESTTGTDTGSGCGANHPKVGQTALLNGMFHQVAGFAEIVDDCTIELRDFTYDGQGLDVRIYGGLGGNYIGGFPMTEDLLRPSGYDNETIIATLPDGMTLDDLDGLSVWCIDAAIDFGSGTFSP